jgi:hypothetical protein
VHLQQFSYEFITEGQKDRDTDAVVSEIVGVR